jgi:sugar lactone lactonase YvrE
MDPILNLPPDLPPHDAAPLRSVPVRTITEWPVGTFVENICPLADGSFAISVLSEARIDRVWPDGRREVLIQLPAPVTGIVRISDHLFASVGVPDQARWSLWRIDLATGNAEPWVELPDAEFLNGLAILDSATLLACEAAQGRIVRIDLEARTSTTWFADALLTKAPEAPFLPGANGLKLLGGHAYVTSNGRALVVRIAIDGDGNAGSIETIASRLRADDLAFDVMGNAYLCTHIGHSLDRLGPTGERVTLAGVAEGMAGSTACAFGIAAGETEALYVTTTGGIIGPPGGVLQPARLVRLEVGVRGAPLLPSLGEDAR